MLTAVDGQCFAPPTLPIQLLPGPNFGRDSVLEPPPVDGIGKTTTAACLRSTLLPLYTSRSPEVPAIGESLGPPVPSDRSVVPDGRYPDPRTTPASGTKKREEEAPPVGLFSNYSAIGRKVPLPRPDGNSAIFALHAFNRHGAFEVRAVCDPAHVFLEEGLHDIHTEGFLVRGIHTGRRGAKRRTWFGAGCMLVPGCDFRMPLHPGRASLHFSLEA